MAYALDTNIIIHLLRHTPAVLSRRDEAIRQNIQLIIPPYVNYEIWRGFRYVPASSKEKSYKRLCVRCPVGEMTAEVWERAAIFYGDLRRAGRTVCDADLLIAAFCVTGGHTLVTNNTKDFENIEGLQIVDWTQE